MYDIPEDEGANTNESDCQPDGDFQQKQTSELAKCQLPLELYKVLCNRPSEEENRHRWQSTTH